jgi:hypothetical protein
MSAGSGRPERLLGLLAEYHDREELVRAAEQVRDAGYRRFDAYTPYPIEELAHIVGARHSALPGLVFVGGLIGGVAGFALCYWSSVVAYPMNIGGRPFNSWPAFIIPTFETTILFAAFTAVLGMLALNGLPRPHHPVFNVPRFALASRDSYFLYVEARDARFDLRVTRELLARLGAVEVSDVAD